MMEITFKEPSNFTTGDKLLVEGVNSTLHEAKYMFDSIMNQGMIWVKFDSSFGNDLNKILSSICRTATAGMGTRKKKASDYYGIGNKGGGQL